MRTPVTGKEMSEFVQYINSCSLFEIMFKSSSYTWWNGGIEEECIFKRLDRVFWKSGVYATISSK